MKNWGQNLFMPVFKCDRVQHPMVRLPRKGQIIFGLSGNPGAAFNGWH